MKQNYQSALWHRCGTCGTVFVSIEDLTRHNATHKSKRFVPRRRATVPNQVPKTPIIKSEDKSELFSDSVKAQLE